MEAPQENTRVGDEFNTIRIEPIKCFPSLIKSDTVPADGSQECMTDLRPNMLWCEKVDRKRSRGGLWPLNDN